MYICTAIFNKLSQNGKAISIQRSQDLILLIFDIILSILAKVLLIETFACGYTELDDTQK